MLYLRLRCYDPLQLPVPSPHPPAHESTRPGEGDRSNNIESLTGGEQVESNHIERLAGERGGPIAEAAGRGQNAVDPRAPDVRHVPPRLPP